MQPTGALSKKFGAHFIKTVRELAKIVARIFQKLRCEFAENCGARLPKFVARSHENYGAHLPKFVVYSCAHYGALQLKMMARF